jgi:hypothetical protein
MQIKLVINARGKIKKTRRYTYDRNKFDQGNRFLERQDILIDSRLHILEKFMTTKPTTPDITPPSPTTGGPEDFKDHNLKYNLSKFDYDLYHEEDDVAEKIIRVKRIDLPNKGERWKIYEDNTVIFVLEGTKLTKKEKEFLRSVDGANFLLKQARAGIKSFNALKTEIKNIINNGA